MRACVYVCVYVCCLYCITVLRTNCRFNKLAKLLVEEHGAAVDALSLAKKTPMHMAAETGQKAVCATLLNMGADANAPDEVRMINEILLD